MHRASQEEKQQYAQIQQRKSELSQRLQEISTRQEALNERDRLNVFPKKPISIVCVSASRQAKEAADNATRKRYREALEAYRLQNSAILTERIKLMGEFLELKTELDEFVETEKWLLLSIAIKNQSSLLGFMQV